MYTDNLLSYQIFSESLYENFALFYNPNTKSIQTWNTPVDGESIQPFDPTNQEHLDAARAEAIGLFKEMDSPVSNGNRGIADELWGFLTPEEQNEHLTRVSNDYKNKAWFGSTPGSDKFYKDKLTKDYYGYFQPAESYRLNVDGSPTTANPESATTGSTESQQLQDTNAPTVSNPALPPKDETIEQQIDRMGVKNWIESQGGMDSFVDNAYSGTYRHGNERKNVWGKYYDELQREINNSNKGQEEIASWNKPQPAAPATAPVDRSQVDNIDGRVEQSASELAADPANIADAGVVHANAEAQAGNTTPAVSDPFNTRNYTGDGLWIDGMGRLTTGSRHDADTPYTAIDWNNPEHKALVDQTIQSTFYNDDGTMKVNRVSGDLDRRLADVMSTQEAQNYVDMTRDGSSYAGSNSFGRYLNDRVGDYYRSLNGTPSGDASSIPATTNGQQTQPVTQQSPGGVATSNTGTAVGAPQGGATKPPAPTQQAKKQG